jgi:hypothetical protein
VFLRVALRESDGPGRPKAFEEGPTNAVCYTTKWQKSSRRSLLGRSAHAAMLPG